MQPLPNSNDIPTLLSRYHTWAEKQEPRAANGNGHRNGDGIDGVRELTYEEVLAQHRNRQPAQRARRTASTRPRAAAEPGAVRAESPEVLTPPIAVIEVEKPQLTAELPLSETPAPAEEKIASPQVELPFAREPRSQPNAQTPTATAAKKTRKPAVALSEAGPVKKAPHPASRPKATVAEKASARPLPKAAKPTATTRPETKKRSAAVARKCARKHPEFRQVLKKTVHAAKKSTAAKKAKEPDRTRRITTRFSTAEERRIEKAASLDGVTVSAYLRKCALGGERANQSRRSRLHPQKRRGRQTAEEQWNPKSGSLPSHPPHPWSAAG